MFSNVTNPPSCFWVMYRQSQSISLWLSLWFSLQWFQLGYLIYTHRKVSKIIDSNAPKRLMTWTMGFLKKRKTDSKKAFKMLAVTNMESSMVTNVRSLKAVNVESLIVTIVESITRIKSVKFLGLSFRSKMSCPKCLTWQFWASRFSNFSEGAPPRSLCLWHVVAKPPTFTSYPCTLKLVRTLIVIFCSYGFWSLKRYYSNS